MENQINSFMSGVFANNQAQQTPAPVAQTQFATPTPAPIAQVAVAAPTSIFGGLVAQTIKTNDFDELPDGEYNAVTQSIVVKTTSNGSIMSTITYKVFLDEEGKKFRLVFQPVFFPTPSDFAVTEDFKKALDKRVGEIARFVKEVNGGNEEDAVNYTIQMLQAFEIGGGKEIKVIDGFDSTLGKLKIKTIEWNKKDGSGKGSKPTYTFKANKA